MCCMVEATAHLRGLCVIEHTGMMELGFAGEYRKRSGNPVFRCHFFHHESHVTIHGTEPATKGWAAGIRVLSFQLWHNEITLQLANWAKYWEECWGSKNRLWAVTVFSLLVQTRRDVKGGGVKWPLQSGLERQGVTAWPRG